MFRRILHYYSEGIPSRRDFPRGFRGLCRYILTIFSEMPPGISRLLKLQPGVALLTGFILIFLLRKGFEHVPFVMVFVVFIFFYINFRLYLLKKKSGMITKVTDLAVMFLINDMLLFVLPFYLESMTFLSRNMVFGFIIIGLTAISVWYFAYERLIRNSVFASSIYYALVFFCVLNFIFPIILGMRNIWSLALSGGIAAITAVLLVYPHMLNKTWRSPVKFVAGILLSLCFLWFGRSLIPPAPLKLTSATACEDIADHSPVKPFYTNSIDNAQEVYFFTAIFAPKGLSERIDHVWYHNGERLFSVSLSEITGGRREGFRTWSKHTIMEGPGTYTIEIWTGGGQLLGHGSFILR